MYYFFLKMVGKCTIQLLLIVINCLLGQFNYLINVLMCPYSAGA